MIKEPSPREVFKHASNQHVSPEKLAQKLEGMSASLNNTHAAEILGNAAGIANEYNRLLIENKYLKEQYLKTQG